METKYWVPKIAVPYDSIGNKDNGSETIIESGKPTFFTVKPASKWRKPFLDE